MNYVNNLFLILKIMKKKILLVLALASLSLPTFASGISIATGWCWVNDDGDTETATFSAAKDETPITVKTGTDAVIRLRIRFDNQYQYEHDTYDLKYFTAPLPTTTFYGNNTSSTPIGPDAFFDWAVSAYVSDGTPLQSSRGITYNSNNMLIQQTVFSPGIFVSSKQNYTFHSRTYTEIEYSIIPTIKAEIGTYYFMPGGMVQISPQVGNLETFPELYYEGLPISVKGVKSASIKIVSLDGSIKLYSLPEGSVKIALINSIGQTVKTINAEVANGQWNISTGDLASGLYIIDIAGVASKKVLVK